MWCDVGGGLVKVCIFHSQKMHVYLIVIFSINIYEIKFMSSKPNVTSFIDTYMLDSNIGKEPLICEGANRSRSEL